MPSSKHTKLPRSALPLTFQFFDLKICKSSLLGVFILVDINIMVYMVDIDINNLFVNCEYIQGRR